MSLGWRSRPWQRFSEGPSLFTRTLATRRWVSPPRSLSGSRSGPARLVCDYLLGPERDPDRLLGGETQRLVARVRVKRLGPSENRCQGLDRHPSDIIVRLLSSQCLATGLRMKP